MIHSLKTVIGAIFVLGLFAFVPLKAAADGDTHLVLHRGDTEHVFTVEVADTPETRASGLMFRKELADDAGMLFIYPGKQKISMWMKNTLISLDMLFLDRDGMILHISERTTPLSTQVISSRFRVKAVLEVVAGTVERLGLRAGDRVEHDRLAADR
ncbi:DUF192 domain-containing protein [Nisaea denitrificans]|uniref:DUF192 domain-containing protein n=1 Tax=Nisaea denitrificans TaxID=390877 RepID=UPI0012EC7A68|nr:DUF192 domain-containing protein [Nisaea denitrificans]